MIKSLPIEENPREKALNYGVEVLSNVELLALILRTGSKSESVIELSGRLLNEIGGISKLSNISYSDLVHLKGIKNAKAIELLAVIELSKRIKEKDYDVRVIKTPDDVYRHLKDKMMFLKQEHFIVLCLNNKNEIIKEKTVFIGSLNMSIVTPREVFKEAVSVNSACIILIHNHPSGNALPSNEDIELTNNFIHLGEMMNIQVVDHIVFGWNQYYSITSKKLYKEN